MDTPISRAEHEEFARRIEEEHKRQNRRLEMVEDSISQIITRQISTLTGMIEKTAISVENLLREQEKQEARLDALEGRDGEMWRKVVGYIITAAVGILVGFLFRQIGITYREPPSLGLQWPGGGGFSYTFLKVAIS